MRRAIALAVVTASAAGLYWLLVRTAFPARALAVGEPPVKADAILVPSGDPEPEYERTHTAVDLYREGWAPVVVFTGHGVEGDNATRLSQLAQRFGLPAAAIRIEDVSRSTHENMAFSAPILRQLGARKVLLVTSPFHLLRATLVAHREMPEIDFIPVAARHPRLHPDNWRRRPRALLLEWTKLMFYLARRFA